MLFRSRGTVARRDWHERVRAYLAGYGAGAGPLLAAFGVASLTVAIAVPDAARRAQLLAWIGAVLRETGREDQADLFFVTDADPAVRSPEEFFLAPVWTAPLRDETLPLVESPRPLVVAGKGGG